MTKGSPHIGTLREKPLHASLKNWYAHSGDRVEILVDGFVIDLVRDDLLIEVQTRSFASLKKKVTTLLGLGHGVRIVHPIAIDRWIVKVGEDGALISRRRSPKHGAPVDVFAELVSIPELLMHPGLEIHVLMTTEEEYRHHTPGRSWRRGGWSVLERHLVDVVDSLHIDNNDDLASLLPAELPQPFTTADLADAIGRPRRTAQQMAYCLRIAQIVSQVGKSGNSVKYQVN